MGGRADTGDDAEEDTASHTGVYAGTDAYANTYTHADSDTYPDAQAYAYNGCYTRTCGTYGTVTGMVGAFRARMMKRRK